MRRLREYEPDADSDPEYGPLLEPPLLDGDDPNND
jgi:hypothetical protein